MARQPLSKFLNRPCPSCGKPIPTLIPCPRDYSLFLGCLQYRVPIEQEITEAWVETARLHCKMKPQRLAELRDPDGPHARHFGRMLERRAARLEIFRKTGELPPSWRGLMPGERDHLVQMQGFHEYRHGGLARLKAKLRNRPEAFEAKMKKRRALDIEAIKARRDEEAAEDALHLHLVEEMGVRAGTITQGAYKLLEAAARDRKRRRRTSRPPSDTPGTHLSGGEPSGPAQGESPGSVQAT